MRAIFAAILPACRQLTFIWSRQTIIMRATIAINPALLAKSARTLQNVFYASKLFALLSINLSTFLALKYKEEATKEKVKSGRIM